MPSSATITTWNVMVAGTKARASQVNANLDNFRGHLLPIDPNTAASAHNTYDLGATDAYWKRVWLKEAPYINGSQPGKLEIQAVYDGSLPTDCIDDIAWLGSVAFKTAIVTDCRFQFVVPAEYNPGNRISLNLKGYCDIGGKYFTMETMAAHYRAGLDNMSLTAPANVLTSTSSILPNTSTAGMMVNNTSLRLTDASGMINSHTVTSGDVIAVDLKRRATYIDDTNTGYFYCTSIIVDLNN